MKTGHKLFSLAAAVVFLLFASQAMCADKVWINVEGYVLFKNDKGVVVKKNFVRYRDIRFDDNPKKIGHFFCLYDNIETQISVKEIEKITLIKGSKEVDITTRSGKKHKVFIERDLGLSLTNADYMQIKYLNNITEKMDMGYVPSYLIEEVHFNTEASIDQ